VTTSALGARLADRNGPGAGDGSRLTAPGSLPLAGLRAACAAAGAGLALMTMLALAGWIAAPHLGLGLVGVLRTAAVLWLVGHHVTVQVSGAGRIGMLPLGLTALPGVLLWWAGRSVVSGHPVTGPRQVVSAAFAVAVPYAGLAGALAVASRSALASASLAQAVLAAFAVAVVSAGLGAARALAPLAQLSAMMSARSRSVLVGTASALLVLIGAGALTTALALAGHVHQFRAMYRLLDPGAVGSGLLLLGQLAYLPNAVLWAVAYMLGPGFAVGTGTVVAPTGSVLGALPAFPMLAALPTGAHGAGPGWLGAALLAVPYLAGAAAGVLAARQAPTLVLEAAPIRGFCGGALAGGVLGLLAAFAGGPLGDGRLSAVGPSAWQVAAVATLELGIAAAVTAGAVNWWQVRADWRALQAEATADPVAVPEHTATQSQRGPGHSQGHVIFLDRWAQDAAADEPSRRPRGPADLP